MTLENSAVGVAKRTRLLSITTVRRLFPLVLALAACRPATPAKAPATANEASDAPSADAPQVASEPPPPADPDHPQHPTPPFPYASHDVEYTNAVTGLKQAGTLTVPKGDGKHAAVILISGSGSQDRNSEVFGHRPFAVIADHLSRKGISVLRVDDRGVGGSELGENLDVTSADFAIDVRGSVDFLRTREEIDPERIALVGHSEGGMLAPMVAVEDERIAAIVLLAGPGVPGDELLIGQTAAILKARGAEGDILEIGIAQQKRTIEAIATAESVEAARARVLEITGVDTPQVREAIEAQIIPWMLYFVQYDPAPTLARVQCPVLALGGSLDTQVVATQNLPAIEAAVRKGGNDDVQAEELAGLNHMFQPAKTGDVSEYKTSKITFDEAALDRMSDWLTSRLHVETTP